jgi:hypothetical protein
MDPLPRFPELDRRLAEQAGTPALQESLQVYGDWLVEQGHPLGEWITEERLAQSDEEVRRRRMQRRFESCDPLRFPSFEFGWTAGVVTRVDGIARSYEHHATEAIMLFFEPWLGLVSEVRLEITGEHSADKDLLSSLATLPPSTGRLALCDPRVPEHAGEAEIDLSHLDLPHLQDLRLRISRLRALPPQLSGLRRLELCVSGPVSLPALPQLRELHLWTRGTTPLQRLLRGAPSLEVLGLHHPGSVRELFEQTALPFPESLQELVLCVPSVSQQELQLVRDKLPSLRVVRLPWVSVQGPLSAPFVAEPRPDQPVYVF